MRAFLPVAVAPELLEQVFRVAQSAPSNCNTQPWVVHVVSGKKLAKLGALLQEAVERGEYSMDFPYSGQYEGKCRERQHEAAALLYGVMGIARDDREARQQAFLRNFAFFGAPHVAFLFLPEEFSLREAADLGMYAQNLMLTMRAAGLGSCAQTALGFHANQVREFLGVPPAMKLLFGISFGYEDSAGALLNASACPPIERMRPIGTTSNPPKITGGSGDNWASRRKSSKRFCRRPCNRSARFLASPELSFALGFPACSCNLSSSAR